MRRIRRAFLEARIKLLKIQLTLLKDYSRLRRIARCDTKWTDDKCVEVANRIRTLVARI